MNRELHKKLRRMEGARADRTNRPRISGLPPRSDGRPWTEEEEDADRSWVKTTEEFEAIHCSDLAYQEIEDRITRELHRRIEQAASTAVPR